MLDLKCNGLNTYFEKSQIHLSAVKHILSNGAMLATYNLIPQSTPNLKCIFHCPTSIHMLSFLWSVFPRIWSEYVNLRRKSLYSVQIRGNTYQKKLRIWTLFGKWFIVMITDTFNFHLTVKRFP